MMGKLAAFDFTITSLLISSNLPEASVTVGSAENIKTMMCGVGLGMYLESSRDLWVLGYKVCSITACLSLGHTTKSAAITALYQKLSMTVC